ncbi:hypothetical protein [Prevotella sp.]|jgi:hypothetical protein|uniref:hypothetical protein n=1 Tax=uncultured Prevotella sp. TaxID=159272 RepID=UPI0025F5FFD3|nr:hypothetical protein [Prevotella sp.]MBD9246686.1 hypothetical protein [Prevotella sp.]
MNQTVHRLLRALMMMFMLALLPLGTHARQFVVDQPLSDSVRCEEVVRNDTAWTTKGGNAHIYLRNGEIIDSCGSIYKSSIVFRHGSKYYYLSRHSLLWSRTNADYLSDPMTFKQHLVHSSVGRFYSTLWACWTVIGLFAVVVIMLICCRFWPLAMAQALQVVMPFSLFAVAVIEALGYWVMGSDAFWWCSSERYGFFGVVLRLIPFVFVVGFQVVSIGMYDWVLFLNDGPDSSRSIHVKPAAVCMVLFLPIMIGLIIVAELVFSHTPVWAEWVIALFSIGILLYGIGKTLMLNIRETNVWKGTLLTVFVIVYIIGCIVVTVSLVMVVLKVIFQLLCALFLLSILLGGSAGNNKIYKDRYGNLYRRIS